MQVACTTCGRTIPATDVNIERLVARCTGCDSVFDISAQFGPPAEPRGVRARAPVPLPSSLTIVDRGLSPAPHGAGGTAYRGAAATAPFELTRRWFRPAVLVMVVFCVAWDGFLVFWYSAALLGATQPHKVGSGLWLMFLFPIGHVAVGVGLTYSTLATLVNRTRIAVNGPLLTVDHGPIPWRGNWRIPVEDLEQIYCQELTRTNRNSSSTTFNVVALLKSGTTLKLLTALPEADQALYIEQAIESHLGIEDVPVGGELPR